MKFGHQNLDHVQETGKLGQIKGISNDIAKYNINCLLCKYSAAIKLPRGPLKDITELRKGSRTLLCKIVGNEVFNT